MNSPETPPPNTRRAVLRTSLVLAAIALGFYGWFIVKAVRAAGGGA